MASIITIYIKEKRTHAAERTLSLPACPWQLSGQISTSQIHPAALCCKPDPAQILAQMPYFTTTVNTSSIMGTKFYFLLVLPLSADDIIPVAAPPMSAAAAGVPGGCSPRCAALPTQPRVGGKPDLLPHPGFWGIPPLPSAFTDLFIYFNTCLSLCSPSSLQHGDASFL